MKSKETAGVRINLGLKEEVRFTQMKQREATSQEEEITSRDRGAWEWNFLTSEIVWMDRNGFKSVKVCSTKHPAHGSPMWTSQPYPAVLNLDWRQKEAINNLERGESQKQSYTIAIVLGGR